jgi:hypothetical protein
LRGASPAFHESYSQMGLPSNPAEFLLKSSYLISTSLIRLAS